MCQKHEEYYRDQNEKLNRYLSLVQSIRENPNDADAIFDYLYNYRSPRKKDDPLLWPREELVAHILRAKPDTYCLMALSEVTQMLRHRTPTPLLSEVLTEAKEAVFRYRPELAESAHFQLGQAYYYSKQFDLAVNEFSRADTSKNYLYAFSLVETQRFTEALPILQTHVSLDKRGARTETCNNILEYLARALEGLGRHEEAQVTRRRKYTRTHEELPPKPLLPEQFSAKFEELFPLEQEIIENRFGFYGKQPMTLLDVANLHNRIEPDEDTEFVKHIEEEATRKLGETYESLMMLYHPGFVHDESTESQLTFQRRWFRKLSEKSKRRRNQRNPSG